MSPPPETHTPIQRFRLDAEVWKEFGEVVGDRNRSAVIGQFIRWYVGTPGEKMPRRKTARDDASAEAASSE